MVDVPLIAAADRPNFAADRVSRPHQHDALRELAEKFETAFLSEMLRHSGMGKMPEGFNGGAGEARFSGFLVEAYATEIAKSGQIGLADHIYRDLLARGAQ